MSSENNKCPICNGSTKLTNSYFNVTECNRCVYQISDYTKGDITKALKMDEIGIKDYATNYESSKDYNDATALCIEVAKKAYKGEFSDIDIPRSIISYALRNGKKDQFIDTQSLVKILKNKSLPTPAELANNFILFLGDRLSSPSDFYNVLLAKGVKENICGLLGIKTGKNEWNDLRFVIKSLEEQEIINSNYKTDDTIIEVSLTFVGWQKYEELKRSIEDSKKAFIAMKFFDKDDKKTDYYFQNELLDNYLKPAVEETGYKLGNPLADNPIAGNIHARMEVEIRQSRFIIAELTHHNNGAYWEAGFARGLGKPVIYMCEKQVYESEVKPHFDVGSDHIVMWEKDEPKEAAEKLKGVIRATLPNEAIMEDKV